jgi:hypothetical protein
VCCAGEGFEGEVQGGLMQGAKEVMVLLIGALVTLLLMEFFDNDTKGGAI